MSTRGAHTSVEHVAGVGELGLLIACLGFFPRIALAFALFDRYPSGVFPDDRYYRQLVETLAGLRINAFTYLISGLNTGYTAIGVSLYSLFGTHFAVIILNSAVGAATSLWSYAIARNLGLNVRRSGMAALLTAFDPNLVLWASVNLKDSLIVFVSLAWLYSALVLLQPGHRVKGLAMVVAWSSALFFLRFYYAIALGLALILTWAVGSSRHRTQFKWVVVPAVVTLALIWATRLRNAETWAEAWMPGAVYQRALVQLDQWGGTLSFLERLPWWVGMWFAGAHLLLTPSPLRWEGTTAWVIPGALMWYAIFPWALVTITRVLRFRMTRAWLLISLVFLCILFLTSLSPFLAEVRHRAALIPIGVVLALGSIRLSTRGIGLAWLLWALVFGSSLLATWFSDLIMGL